MQDSTRLLIVAGIGLVTGIMQCCLFLRHSSEVKTFAAHLDDLRFHAIAAIAIMSIVVSVMLIRLFPQQALEQLGLLFGAFSVAWIIAVASGITYYVKNASKD